jgi:hypothetical protein
MQTELRRADLNDLAALLRQQNARKTDVVAPATAIHAERGEIVVDGSDVVLTEEGVTTRDGVYKPTSVFDEGVAAKLGIPAGYLRRMAAERPDLYDANVNGWLHGGDTGTADPRSFLIRAFRGDSGPGIARAFLSDSYRMIDHLDILTSALDGIRSAGVDVEISQCDLTERKMYVVVNAPQITTYAPELLAGYRSPFTGQTGADNPVVSAGFVITNSETGGGAATIVPRMTILVCKNGMTVSKDAVRQVHLGGTMEAGVVRWSDETQQKNLALVKAMTGDAVRTFLDTDYMARTIATLNEKAGIVPTTLAADVVRVVGKRMQYSEAETNGILDHFIRGGQFTAGGVMQAVTSYAQTVDDPDAAWSLEESALKALEVAALV